MQDEVLVPGVELLESMRSVGYSFEAAIADLIDNSITARAKNIEIVGDPIDAKYVTILDDGSGMDPTTARAALRLAGSVGDGTRAAGDLGRFGLGLKTASLSQARRLTVVTRREGTTTALEWDIDHVRSTGQWSLRVLAEEDTDEIPEVEKIRSMASGTLVIWQELDYLLGDADDPGALMAERLAALRTHVGLTFHRFLEGGPRGFRISVNGIQVEPIDPFLSSNPRTQSTPIDRVLVDGVKVDVRAFTLPHASALTAKERARPDLGAAMRENQGFYIYRNRRLISHGHWYGLARREELSKQSRVQVDIPNTLDHLWQLDIKKSRAEPPQAFKLHLKRVMDQVVDRSKRVYTFRGRRETESDVVRLWSRVSERTGYRYEINTEHPSILVLQESLRAEQRSAFLRLLRDISISFPSSDLYARAAQNSHPSPANLEESELIERLRHLIVAAGWGDVEQAFNTLRTIEPFHGVHDLRSLLELAWKEKQA